MLSNGLKVYLIPVRGSPVVTTMVAYRVGSGDEEKDQTGLSHYLEHLLFKGTETLMPGDIDRATQRNGGRNNAYTDEDMTVYHFDFAADRWEIGLEIEADRMRNVRIDEKHEFQQEKGAVVAELKGNEDGPWDLEYKSILPLLFPKDAPYAHPVIGEEKHVRSATAEIIRRHYDKWYHPNNAVLVVAGGIDPDLALKKIQTLFGPIPKGELPPRKQAPETAKRTEQARHEFPSKFDVPRAIIGFNTVRAGDPDDYVLDVVDQVLSAGKTARLYRRLVEGDQLAAGVMTGNYAGRHPGWFAVQVEMLPGKDRKQAEEAVFDEMMKLAREPITEAELNRARRSILASFVFGREDVHNLADLVARTVTRNDLDYLTTYLDRVFAVTPTDVQRVAGNYLTKPASVVVWSVTDGKGEAGEQPRQPGRRPAARSDRQSTGLARNSISLEAARRVVLPNGLTLLLLENHRLPIVVAEVYVKNVRLREPAEKAGIAMLLGNLLDEGTPTRTGQQISAAIEDVGGRLTFSSSGGSIKVLTPDTALGLELLLDSVIRPALPADAIERKRSQQLALIADLETQPQSRARQRFMAEVYGTHPFGRPTQGTKEIVSRLTREDLAAFHRSSFAPDETVVSIVGDFQCGEVAKMIEKLTAAWEKRRLTRPTPPGPPRTAQRREIIIPDPTAAQTHIYLGHIGIMRNHPDYYSLLVMDNVLGTGPGFTDRLSASLRDRQGLAYTVTAQITASASDQPGTFTGYIGTFPDRYLVAREGFLTEIGRIRREVPTNTEVEAAKNYLLGSLPFRLTTNEAIASQLLGSELYGLGLDYLTTYRKRVAAVTPAEVQAVARKHLDPERLVLVAVGPIGSDGKPLPETKK
jgi:zinc protease